MVFLYVWKQVMNAQFIQQNISNNVDEIKTITAQYQGVPPSHAVNQSDMAFVDQESKNNNNTR